MNILKIKDNGANYKINDGEFFIPKENGREDDAKAIAAFLASGGIIEDRFSLTEIKTKKIQEIKAIRDGKNIEPITDCSAETFDSEGNLTGVNTFFIFHTSRHPTNPAADPGSILTGTVIMNRATLYSTKDLSGEKVTVNLTPAIAQNIAAHLALRNNNNYKLSDAIEAAIKAATTQEEVEAITWNVSYLGE